MRYVIATTGGRNYTNFELVKKTLLNVVSDIELILVGDATGADALVRRYAKNLGIPYKVFYANWPEYGKQAGPIRNQAILDNDPKPELLLAFPGGKGTTDMTARAKKVGIEVIEIK